MKNFLIIIFLITPLFTQAQKLKVKEKEVPVTQAQESSNLSLRKIFKNESATSDFTFEVGPGQKRLRVSAQGSCDQGTIEIIVFWPSEIAKIKDQTHYKMLKINSAADVSRSYVLKLDNEDYQGTWRIMINARDVIGNYQLEMSAN
ncbi:hypothetical protein QQ008_10350 [Fulvivirgaceae bacterium BMA10]|uniref:DUF2914 domain-containing protein n=1 Tax=Splendidivirga corallicola TaxID=3051826 RepID=A0ABT8KP09_9BACT|nr:hypothetical protein [Fulvivirgaceae bacterium BMA10]